MNSPTTTDLTVDDLLAMSDDDFTREVTENVFVTKSYSSPFQDRRLIDKTQHALVDHLWRVDATIRAQAEDPQCSQERYRASLSFRRLLLAAIDITDRRMEWMQKTTNSRLLREWKAFAQELIEIIEDGPDNPELDELIIPISGISARAFAEIRRAKARDGAPAKVVAA